MIKLIVVLTLLLLGGCFQVQLYGPISGANITITDLRDGTAVQAETTSWSLSSLLARFGAARWANFDGEQRLLLLGIFELELENLPDNKLFLVTAVGGEDTDIDLDGSEDGTYTEVKGQWHAIMSGAQLRRVGPKVSPLTELVYQWLAAELDQLTDAQILYNLEQAAGNLVSDVNGDNIVSGNDILFWSRLTDSDKLLVDASTVNLITQSVIDNNTSPDRRTWSQQLVGLEVSTNSLSVADQLALALQGLSLDDFFTDSYKALLLRSPESVVDIGLEEIYGLEQAELDNISDAYARETYDMAEVILLGLLAYPRQALSTPERLSVDTYRWYLKDMLAGEAFLLYNYPASYFLTQVPSGTQFFFTDIQGLDTAQDAQDYVTRLKLVDDKFAQLRDNVATRAAAGIVEPLVTMEYSIDRLREVADAPPASSTYYTRFKDALGAIPNLSNAERSALREEVRQIINAQVRPAYDALIADLEALLPQAPQAIGFGQFEGGAAFYDYALRHRTTTTLSAEEIHQIGLDELQRVHDDIRSAAALLGYNSDISLPQLFEQVASDGGILSGSDILSTYEDLLDAAHQRLPEAFDILPQQELVILPDDTGGFYVGGSLDGSRPGAFYARTEGQQSYYDMPTLVYHEGVPGHHLQIALAQEQALPDFRRHTNYTAFVEGWALYAERLAAELGWYDSDPYGDLGRLQWEAVRAARLAVDTGIHDRGWSWDEAVDFYQQNTGSTYGSAQGNVARFMLYPAQATSYMIGMKKILELRDLMQTSLGADYDIADFHNLVLTGGALPLSILEKVVKQASQN
jgi:uncharacterized protein (DUF885 family)